MILEEEKIGCSGLDSSWESYYQGMEKAELEECNKAVYDDIADCLPVDPFGSSVNSPVAAIKVLLRCSEIAIEEDEEGNFDEEFVLGVDFFIDGLFGFESELGDGVVCDEEKKESQGVGGDPHDALFFALGYLGLEDLLSMERVCKSFRDAVRGDALLWKSISIDQPLSRKLTDDVIIKLTSRAQGNLQCLNLVDCIFITEYGLKQVLESNPRLTKLSVPGCIKLNANSILSSLRVLKSAGTLRIKQLRIGGLPDVSQKEFEELKFLLGADDLLRTKKPLFHREGQRYLSEDHDQAIDIEACPRCQKLRLVYDCPTETCQDKEKANQPCRACFQCVHRCLNCGRCVVNCVYEETLHREYMCLDCFKQLLSCQEKPEAEGASSSGHVRCEVYLYRE
ncbi:hypothetical protein Tsubulata_003279 [Turnera subulata]|uniref:F-box domain-containing protein n=1 Tax=Turnera subulata TaxID=218843 RepID=A0A9Q0F9F0_9ROSI|nr:hypothetical protein Tsubulata_003279 [Turnera subulata]